MAQLLTGIQGSGKSYKAMYDIFYGQDKFYRTYSNLDKLINTQTIFSLDFNSFVNYGLKECYKIMVTSNRDDETDDSLTDDEIFKLITTQGAVYEDAIAHLQKIKILPALVNEDNRVLLIIDEAQDYFGKTAKLSAELLWFITQHRHLYIEVVLLTQDVSLIRSDYKLFNAVYDATPPTKQFDKNFFSYHHYAGLPINEANYVGKIKLKREQQIFAMYKSGDKVDSPNILKRFIIMAVSALAVIAISLYLLLDMFGGKVETSKQNSTVKLISDTNRTINQINSSDYSELTYLKLNCIHDTCSNKIHDINLNVDDLNTTVTHTQSKFLAVKVYSKSFVTVSVLVTTDFLNLFQGAKNGKGTTEGFNLIN